MVILAWSTRFAGWEKSKSFLIGLKDASDVNKLKSHLDKLGESYDESYDEGRKYPYQFIIKVLSKFNEGFMDLFKKREKEKEKPQVKWERITVPDCDFFAHYRPLSGPNTYEIYHGWGFGGKPMGYVKEIDGNLILNTNDYFGNGINKVKVKSVEQALKYLDKLNKEKKQKYREEEKGFDKDISDEEF